MLDSSNISQLSQASGESVDDLSLLGDLSFSYDSGVSVATTLVEGILSEFPITQDTLHSTWATNVTSGLEGSKLVADTPQTVLDLESNALSKSVEAITTTTTMPSFESTREKMKELRERRFTHPQKIMPSYALGGRY